MRSGAAPQTSVTRQQRLIEQSLVERQEQKRRRPLADIREAQARLLADPADLTCSKDPSRAIRQLQATWFGGDEQRAGKRTAGAGRNGDTHNLSLGDHQFILIGRRYECLGPRWRRVGKFNSDYMELAICHTDPMYGATPGAMRHV